MCIIPKEWVLPFLQPLIDAQPGRVTTASEANTGERTKYEVERESEALAKLNALQRDALGVA